MKKLIGLLSIIIFAVPLFAQETLKGTEEEYYDFLSLIGITVRPTLGYRTLSDNVWKFADVPDVEGNNHVWENNNLGTTFTLWEPSAPATNWFADGLFQGLTARIYGPEWFNSYNTAAPYGQNDGALWQGRGYNTSLTAGLRLEGYGFELTFKPQVSFSENREFEYIPGVYDDTHSYNWRGNIDLVQRYGDSSFWNYDWGDSEIRWTWHALTFGFGTQNPWLGPAYLNPMLGSNNAPGYLKFDAGLRKLDVILPFINYNIGSIEGRIWVGQLKQSDYFDVAGKNRDRMLTAMSASYEPSFIPGFSFGLNRIFLTYWQPENFAYLLRLFTLSRDNALASSGNDEDQKFSIFAQWSFDKVGFTIYGEFGRDDFSSNENTNPFHTAIYTIGVKQYIPFLFGLKSEFNFEWNNFEMSQDFQLQWPYLGYYAHGFVSQGYTHNGQILGAGSGYFGNSQFIQYKVYYPKGYTAIHFHRYCPNNNSIYSKAVNAVSDAPHGTFYNTWYANFETYLVFGIESSLFITSDLYTNLTFNYLNIKHKNYTDDTLHSFSIQISAKYTF